MRGWERGVGQDQEGIKRWIGTNDGDRGKDMQREWTFLSRGPHVGNGLLGLDSYRFLNLQYTINLFPKRSQTGILVFS